jgi:uncharacterized membrane protein YqjE
VHDRGTRPGISEAIHDALSAVGDYLAARLELLRIEAGEAGRGVGKAVAAVVIAGFCAVLAYVSIWVVLIVWTANLWFDGSIVVPVLVAAVIHAAAAVGLAAWGWSVFKGGSFFVATRQEILEDRQWLTEQQKSKR